MGGGQDNGYQALITKTIAANAVSVDISSPNSSTEIVQATGTWSGTLLVEGSNDGTTYYQILIIDRSTKLLVASITSNGSYTALTNGFQLLRIRSTVWSSGTVTLNVYGSDASSMNTNIDLLAGSSDGTMIGNIGDRLKVYNASAGNNNSAYPPQSTLIGGSDGTNLVPIAVDSLGRLVTSSLTGFGADFAFGDITTASTTRVLVRRTAYTEQTTNGQRSVASANANDTAAGTGARTIKITYLDQTGAGPFTETLTLNGTARVNTVATNICFIEQMEIVTAGSTGSNTGIITLFTVPTAGGTAIGTIAATNNQTFWAHHYVPTGKDCKITGISCGHNGTTVGSGALFTLNATPIGVANAIESQVSDFVRLYGQTSTFARAYTSPINVTGPARLQMYVTPETSTSTIYRGAFDFFQP